MNVELTWVDPDDLDAWRQAVRPTTKAFFGETIGNPAGNVLDIEAVAEIAHAHGLPLIVDNTFATPYLCRPIEWGADIVIHSATKFIGGHGTSIGGVVVESGLFNWSNGRFPVVADPSPAYHGLQFHETFGTYGYLMKLRAETLRDLGARDVAVQRLPVPAGAGDAVAADGAPRGERPGGRGVPGVPRARVEGDLPRPAGKQIPAARGEVPAPRGGGGVLVRLRRRPAGGQQLISGVRLWSHLANVGDAKSLIIHPASTTHRQLSDQELQAAGVGPGSIRLSVGLETPADLIWDLEQGFACVTATDGNGGREGSDGMTDLSRYQDPLTIQRVLHTARTVAIVGLSANPLRASYFVGYYLQRHGYQVIPVNPRETEILGEKCYPSLLDVPVHVDVVDVFRTPDAVPAIAREALQIEAGALWCQFGVISEEGAQIAVDGGLPVVMDRCLKIEHARYLGRMHWLGFSTQRITSVRTGLQ